MAGLGQRTLNGRNWIFLIRKTTMTLVEHRFPRKMQRDKEQKVRGVSEGKALPHFEFSGVQLSSQPPGEE